MLNNNSGLSQQKSQPSLQCNPTYQANLQTILNSKLLIKPNIIHRHSSISLYTKTTTSTNLTTGPQISTTNTPIALIASNKSAVCTETGQNNPVNQSLTQLEPLPSHLPFVASQQRLNHLTTNQNTTKIPLVLTNNNLQSQLEQQNKNQQNVQASFSKDSNQLQINSPRKVHNTLKQDIINWVCGDSKLNFDEILQKSKIDKNKGEEKIESARISTEPITDSKIQKNSSLLASNDATDQVTSGNRRSRRGLRYLQDGGIQEKEISLSSEPKSKNLTETNEGSNKASSYTSFSSLEQPANKRSTLSDKLPQISMPTKIQEKSSLFEQLQILKKSSLHSKISAVHDKALEESSNNKQLLQTEQPIVNSGENEKESKFYKGILRQFENSKLSKNISSTEMRTEIMNTLPQGSTLGKDIQTCRRRRSEGYKIVLNSEQNDEKGDTSTNVILKQKAGSVHVGSEKVQDDDTLQLLSEQFEKEQQAELKEKRKYSSFPDLPLPAQIQSQNQNRQNPQSLINFVPIQFIKKARNIVNHNLAPDGIPPSNNSMNSLPSFNRPVFKRIEKSSSPQPSDPIVFSPNTSSSNDNEVMNSLLANTISPPLKKRELLPSLPFPAKQEKFLSDSKDLSPTKTLKNLVYFSPNGNLPNRASGIQASPQSSFLQSPGMINRQLLLKKFNKLETINQDSQNLSQSNLSPRSFNNTTNNVDSSSQMNSNIFPERFNDFKSSGTNGNNHTSHLDSLYQITSSIGGGGGNAQQSQDQQPTIQKRTEKYIPSSFNSNLIALSAMGLNLNKNGNVTNTNDLENTQNHGQQKNIINNSFSQGKQGYNASRLIENMREQEANSGSIKTLKSQTNNNEKKVQVQETTLEEEWNFDAKVTLTPQQSKNNSILKSPGVFKSILKNPKNLSAEDSEMSQTKQHPPKRVSFL